jgi:hypothetical protein
MTPAQASVDVHVATDDDLRAAIRDVLDSANVGLDELRAQARASRFSSEEARVAWFMIAGLVDRVCA